MALVDNISALATAIGTKIRTKQDTVTGGATTITSSNLTTSRALTSDTNGKVAVSATTSAELEYLSGVTSSVQTQINEKQPTLGFTPIQQGGGTSQVANKIFLGWSAAAKLRVQVDATDFGSTFPIDISGNAATATTANNGVVASSNATNGYVKLGNGTIIQWMTWTDNGQWTTRSFPITFPNACTGISFTPSSGGDSISTSVVTLGSGFSKSSFRSGFNGGNGWIIRMIAVGY